MLYYTDGACVPNPGRGGWGFVVLAPGFRTKLRKLDEKFGGEEYTTNNRMELTAIIEALRYAAEMGDEDVSIHTDSQLCKNTCEEWIFWWERKGILDKRANPDLLREVLPLLKSLKPTFHWVRGHNGDEWNEYADGLSNEYLRTCQS